MRITAVQENTISGSQMVDLFPIEHLYLPFQEKYELFPLKSEVRWGGIRWSWQICEKERVKLFIRPIIAQRFKLIPMNGPSFGDQFSFILADDQKTRLFLSPNEITKANSQGCRNIAVSRDRGAYFGIFNF